MTGIEKGDRRRKSAALVRGGEWDSTQAGPRALATLQAQGFDVTIYCWDLTGEKQPYEAVDGAEIHRYQRYVPAASAWYFLSWPSWWAWLFVRYIRGKYELIHAMNLDGVVPAVCAKLFRRHKVVYDVRDAWGLCLTTKSFPIPQVMTLLDRLTTPLVDGLLLSQGALDVCARFYGAIARGKVPTIQVLNVPQRDTGATTITPVRKPLRINYCGRISQLRAAYLLADAIEGRSDLEMDVYGKLRDEKVLKRYEGMPNIILHGTLNHAQSLARMSKSSIVSLLYDPSLEVVAISSANKMFEAMMLGKPYLCTAGTYPARIAARFRLGWAIEYGDVDALRQLFGMLAASPALITEAGQRGRQAYETHYMWEYQQANLILLYRYVLGDKTIQTREHQGWRKFIGDATD